MVDTSHMECSYSRHSAIPRQLHHPQLRSTSCLCYLMSVFIHKGYISSVSVSENSRGQFPGRGLKDDGY